MEDTQTVTQHQEDLKQSPGGPGGGGGALANFFNFDGLRTDLRTEVLAGITTFVTMGLHFDL